MRQGRMSSALSWMVLGLVLVGALGFYLFSQKPNEATPSEEGLETYNTVGEFQFDTHHGTQLSNSELKGKVWVAYFFFSTCAGICPTMNKNMMRVQTALKSNPDFQILGFTVDPKVDTVTILNAYSGNFGVDPQTWHFLTGDKRKIYHLARESFKLGVDEIPPDPGGARDFIHSEKLVLVDRAGVIRGYYDGTNVEEVERLIKDASKLLKEKS